MALSHVSSMVTTVLVSCSQDVTTHMLLLHRLSEMLPSIQFVLIKCELPACKSIENHTGDTCCILRGLYMPMVVKQAHTFCNIKIILHSCLHSLFVHMVVTH